MFKFQCYNLYLTCDCLDFNRTKGNRILYNQSFVTYLMYELRLLGGNPHLSFLNYPTSEQCLEGFIS